MKILNGQPIPDHLSISELEQHLQSPDMQTFCLACEALRLTKTDEAYQVLKPYLSATDQHRRRYALSVIFDFPQAAELRPYLLEALNSKESIFVTTALRILLDMKSQVDDEAVLACLERNLLWLDSSYFQLLNGLIVNSESTNRTLKMYTDAKSDSIRIAIAASLEHFATLENYVQIFDALRCDPAPQIRMVACRIARQFHRQQWLEDFLCDPDGHIRKYAKRSGL